MKQQSQYSFILIFFLFFQIGCKTTSKVPSVASEPLHEISLDSSIEYTAWDDALLWEITKNGVTVKPSYIFGTIHLIDSEKFFYPAETLEKFKNSQEIVFEIDMDKMNDMSAQMSMMGKIFMKDGLTLKDLLSEDDYNLVAAFFDAKGLPMMFANRIKPMFLSSMTELDMESLDMFGKGGGESDMMSYEMEFFQHAEDNKIEVSGLETIDFQISIFDAIPYEAQAEMLVQAVKESGNDDSAKMMDELVSTYVAQNIEGLVSAFSEDDEFAEYEELLLNDRNKNWIPIIEEKVANQSTFFAVGAGHLAGPKGVLHLLRERGYTVKPISNK